MNFFIPIVAFFSVLVGRFLRHAAKEEMKAGEKYFRILERAVLLFMSIAMLYLGYSTPMIFVAFLIGIGLAFITKIRWFCLGLASVSGFLISPEALLLFSSLIFIYGLAYGTMKNKIFRNALLFFAPLLLLLLKTQITPYSYWIAGIAAGALFLRA